MRRTLAVNAFWGIDSESHCHDPDIRTTGDQGAGFSDEDGYIVTLDVKTGELTVNPVTPE